MGIELDTRYQTEAYSQVENDFQNGNRSCVVFPTGCGKSYIALKLIEDNPNDEILYVSSSTIINGQIKSIIQQTYGAEAKKIFPRLRFITYNALSKMKPEEFAKINPTKIVLDELHRAGADVWGKRVNELLEQNPNSKVLGLTATPVRTDGRNMAKEICGGISYELPLTEAVARGILPVPEYICAQYIFEEDIQRVESLIENLDNEEEKNKYRKKLEIARRHLEQSDGLDKIFGKHISKKDGKYILFCKDIEDIDTKANQTAKWFGDVSDKVTVQKISSANEREENTREIRFFKENSDDTLKLALAVNMMNEGYHDKDLAGVIMTRPTMSEILFRQQLGRALSRDAQNTPQIFDLVNNIRYFENFRREIKEIIERGLRGENRQQGERRGYSESVLEKFKIIEEQIDFIEEFKQIEENLRKYIESQTSIGELIGVLEKLQQEGIDISKIQLSKKINGKRYSTTIADIIPDELVKKLGLDKEYKIGQQITKAKRAYRGERGYKITAEEKKKLEELGIIELEERKSAIAELIEILEILQENGVNVANIPLSKSVDGKDYHHKLEDVISNDLIEKLKLNPKYKIGDKITGAKKAYKGKGTWKITEEQKQKLEELGIISLEERKTAVAELLEILELLQENGVNVADIQPVTTVGGKHYYKILSDVLSSDLIEKLKLDPKYKIGNKINGAKNAYKGKGTWKITEEEKKKLEELGIIDLEKKSAVAELLEILEILQGNGVNVASIQVTSKENGKDRYIKLEDLIPKELLEELKLDGEYKLGQQIIMARQAYKGKGCKVTEEEKQKIEDLGIIDLEKKSAVEELIEILEKLQGTGINVGNIQTASRVNGKNYYTKLSDIIGKEVLEELKLDGDYKIGQQITMARQAYKGKRYKITEEEKRRLEALGIVDLEERKTAVAELIEILELLQDNGIDVASIRLTRRVDGKDYDITLADVITKDLIEKLKLDPHYKIGKKIIRAKNAYKGSGTSKITEEEKRRLEALGIVGKLSQKELEQQALIKKRDAAKQLFEDAKAVLGEEENYKTHN